MRRRTRTPTYEKHPLGELYEWVRDMPPDATVHVRSRKGYEGRFDVKEVQGEVLVEEFLEEAYGPGTYLISGHCAGMFLPGKHTVPVVSRRDREGARDMARRPEGASGDAQLPPLASDRGLGWESYQAQPKASRQEAFGTTDSYGEREKTAGFTGSRRERDEERPRWRAAGSDPSRRRRGMSDSASSSSGSSSSSSSASRSSSSRERPAPSAWKPFLLGAAGAAAASGVEHAIRNRESIKRAASRLGARVQGWFLQSPETSHAGNPGFAGSEGATSPKDGWPHSGASPGEQAGASWNRLPRFKTVEEFLDEVRRVSKTQMGGLFIESAKRAIAPLNPTEIAELMWAKVCGWLGDHPLLKDLERDPEAAFEEVADLVGLEGEQRAQAKQALYAMLGVVEAPVADSPEQAS